MLFVLDSFITEHGCLNRMLQQELMRNQCDFNGCRTGPETKSLTDDERSVPPAQGVYLRIRGNSVLLVELQSLQHVGLLDEVCGIQSDVLVEDHEVLSETMRSGEQTEGTTVDI